MDVVVNWLKNDNSRTNMKCLVFLNFDDIVPFIDKAVLFNSKNCQITLRMKCQLLYWKREFKVIQNIKFSQNREI